MTPGTAPVPSFNDLGIRPNLLAALEKMFPGPTPIQHRVIPIANEGKDVVGIAQTGTGKTLAFGIPMLQRLAGHSGQGLVLVPTRELAMQVEEMLMKVGQQFSLKVALIIGGAAMGPQLAALRRKPHVVVATPGRLMDLMNQGKFSLNDIKIVVLDEADRMLDIGFMPQIKEILSKAPSDRQTMLFSATMPPQIAQIAAQFMKQPLRIEVAPAGTTVAKVEQIVYFVAKDQKVQLVEKMLTDHPGTVLVFTRTKFGAKKLTRSIQDMGHTAVEIHSNRSLAQRKDALAGFKSGKYRVLVATDIAARGIDVKNISLVVNFDVPDNTDDYVHRIGRTGRAGGEGKAVTFATPDQKSDIRDIERLIRKQLPISATPTLPPRRASQPYEAEEPMRGGGRFQGGRSSGGRPQGRSSYHSGPPRAFSLAPRPYADRSAAPAARTESRPYVRTESRPAARPFERRDSRPFARPEGRATGGRPAYPSSRPPARSAGRYDRPYESARPAASAAAPYARPTGVASRSNPVIHTGGDSDEGGQYTPKRGGYSRGGGRSSGPRSSGPRGRAPQGAQGSRGPASRGRQQGRRPGGASKFQWKSFNSN